jgi:hypothetical protein
MVDILFMRQFQVFLGCLALALVVAWLATRRARPDAPGWPVRLYLLFLSASNIPAVRRYADARKNFPRREQFLVTFFVCFFILFLAAVFTFDHCGRKGC